MGPLEDSMPTIVELLDKIWPSNWEPKNLANSHPQTVENILPPKKDIQKLLYIFCSPWIPESKDDKSSQMGIGTNWKICSSQQTSFKKKTATLKLVSLLHNPPPHPTPFSPLIPFPFPTLPAQLPSTFHTLNSTGPLGALLGAGLGVFATATFPVFFFKPKNRKRLPQKPPKLWCVAISCGLFQNEWILYGCFLKWWYPQNTPKGSFLVGKPMVVGYHHFRKPPYVITGYLLSPLEKKNRNHRNHELEQLVQAPWVLTLIPYPKVEHCDPEGLFPAKSTGHA